MTPQEQMLMILRDHPEGMTTSELNSFMYPGRRTYASTYTKACKLELYGFVTKVLETRIVRGRKTEVAVWRPL